MKNDKSKLKDVLEKISSYYIKKNNKEKKDMINYEVFRDSSGGGVARAVKNK